MENIFIAFMLLAGIVCLFAIVIVVVDLIKDKRQSRTAPTPVSTSTQTYVLPDGTILAGTPIYVPTPTPVMATVAAPAQTTPAQAEPVPVATPVEDMVPTEEPVSEEVSDNTEVNGVWISRNNEKTHMEKYAVLTDEARAQYDEIKAYVLTQKEVQSRMGNRFEDFRIGKKQVVRMIIRREVLHCEFVILHEDLNTYIIENRVNIKHAPTSIKIDSPEAVIAAKNSIDIAIKAIEADRAFRLEQQKKRRREARARRAAGNAADTE